MATTKWDIAGRVGSRISTTMTSGDIVLLVEDAANDVQNITGLSVNLADVGSHFHGVLTNLAGAYTISKDVGASLSYRTGDFSVNKGVENSQLGFLLNQANNSLNMLGRRIVFEKTEPTT